MAKKPEKAEIARPFGLDFLEPVSQETLEQVNGGRGKKHHPVLTTMHISIPLNGHGPRDYG